jgi:hypothetical protein
MSRSVDSLMISDLSERTFRYAFLVNLALDMGNLAFTSLTRSVAYNSINYIGAGNLGSVGAIQESTTADPRSCDISLSGVNSTTLSALITENYMNRPVTIHVVTLNEDESFRSWPMIYFIGNIASLNITHGKRASITVNATDRLALWNRSRLRRYTNQEQMIEHPTDKGFEFVESLEDAEIVWPTEAYLRKLG